jgi:hypothetical protein
MLRFDFDDAKSNNLLTLLLGFRPQRILRQK